MQRARVVAGAELDFPAQQEQAPFAGIEADIHRRVAVQLEATAVGQGQAPAFADAGGIVGAPALQAAALAQAPGAAAGGQDQQQGLQRAPALRRMRCVDGGQGQWRAYPGQALVDRLDVAPGLLVFRGRLAPALPGLAQAFIVGAALQLDQPAHGLFSHLRRHLGCGGQAHGSSAK